MNYRIWHGCHTPAEAQPPETITLSVEDVVSKLIGWFEGEWGLVKHSRMPQELGAIGDYDEFHRIHEAVNNTNLGFKLLRSLESNVCRKKGDFSLDGNPTQFDVQIASIHSTPQLGWTHGTSPEDFYLAYEALIPTLNSSSKRTSLGHMMYYANGATWTQQFVNVLRLYSPTEIAVGIFVGKHLRQNPSWTIDDLLHPTIGLTVLKPWAVEHVQDMPKLKLTLDWDAHIEQDLLGLNEKNLALLSEHLLTNSILSRFTL